MTVDRHHRHSIRMDGFDYAQPGSYYVTVVTYDRLKVFGEVVDGEVRLSPLGQIAHSEWQRLFSRFPFLVEDESIVMPNHMHGILAINHPDGGSPSLVGAWRGLRSTGSGVPEAVPQHGQGQGMASGTPDKGGQKPHHAPTIRSGRAPTIANGERPADVENRRFGKPRPASIPTIVGAYKSAVTNRARGLRIIPPGIPLRQRNYYEHIIQDEDQLTRLRRYILDNPLRWDTDEENPDCQP